MIVTFTPRLGVNYADFGVDKLRHFLPYAALRTKYLRLFTSEYTKVNNEALFTMRHKQAYRRVRF